jgi:NADPH-dependent 2,4-dienoyl-CoA reductase/sulfur reductase-like enzyme
MRAKYNTDVRIKQEVSAIDKTAKTVTVRKTDTGETYTESYDTLVLSTGSSPVKPPIPGIDSGRVMTLWTVPDTDRIRDYIKEKSAKSAVVVGGGFIGLEMAENLYHAGLKITVVEALDQVMAPLDFEMAQLLHEHLARKGVDLYLGDGVASFEDGTQQTAVHLKSGKQIPADLVILSIGVRPNGELAKAAGLEVNARGGIITDATMKTSDPDIYAVGDVIEVEDFVDKTHTMIPLAP